MSIAPLVNSSGSGVGLLDADVRAAGSGGNERGRPRDQEWRESIKAGLAVWLVTRLAFYLVGAVVVAASASAQGKDRGLPAFAWPFRLFSAFDAGHFLSIARWGYFQPDQISPPQATNPAFFPGYPLLCRALAMVFGLGHPTPTCYLAAAQVISWLSSAAAAVVLHRLVADRLGTRAATGAAVLLFAGPYAVFLVAPYSESLFLALALAAWLAATRDRWPTAALLAAAAASVRINGLFLAAALVIILAGHRKELAIRKTLIRGALLLLPLAPVLGYFYWLHLRTGRWLEWFAAQRLGWGRTTVTPWTALVNSVRRATGPHDAAFQYQSWMEIAFAAVLVASTATLIARKSWPEAAYVGLTAASLLTSHHYLSVPRSTLLCFPIAALAIQAAPRRKLLRMLLASACLLLSALNTATYLSNTWTG